MEALESHLGAARAVLSEAVARLRAEHDAERAKAQRETRQLRAELLGARRREAELEAKLASIGLMMNDDPSAIGTLPMANTSR